MSYSKSQGTMFALFTFPHYYLTIFLVSCMCLLYDLAVSFINLNFNDYPTNLLRKYVYVIYIKKGN